jgi:hypothetical protein
VQEILISNRLIVDQDRLLPRSARCNDTPSGLGWDPRLVGDISGLLPTAQTSPHTHLESTRGAYHRGTGGVVRDDEAKTLIRSTDPWFSHRQWLRVNRYRRGRSGKAAFGICW